MVTQSNNNFDPASIGAIPVQIGNSSFDPATLDGVQSMDTSTPPTTPSTPNPNGSWAPSSPSDVGATAGLKATANVIPSLLNFGGNIANAAIHPVATSMGILHAGSGAVEAGLNAMFGKNVTDINTQTFDKLKSALYDRYGTLENAQKTATNDPVGFGADVLSILEGGASLADTAFGTTGVDIAAETSKTRLIPPELQTGVNATPVGNGTVSGKLSSVLSTVARPFVSGLKTGVSLPFMAGAGVEGVTTGVGYKNLTEGLNATSAGGTAPGSSYSDFVNALHGNTSPEQLVTQAKNGLDTMESARSQNYQGMLSTLEKNTSAVDMTPLQEQFQKQLKQFNITETPAVPATADSPAIPAKLDFSKSVFPSGSDQSAIQAMANDIENFGNPTPRELDILKQRIANYWTPDSKIGAFSEGLRTTARSMLENVPGYSDAMKNYADASEQITQLKRSLSLGDNASIETSFKKLTSAFRGNMEMRQQFIQELDQATGGHLTAKIAGQQMSSIIPRGLAPLLDVGGLAWAHNTGFIPLLGIAMTTSPRIVGEFIRGLGLGIQGTNAVMDVLNKFVTPAVLPANATIRLTPRTLVGQ